MGKYLLVFLLVLATRSIFANDFKTLDGKEYKNVTVSRVEPDGIVLITSSGISKVYFTELPKEVQERFHYDTAKAAAYSSEQAASQEALRKQQEESRRKLADKNNKYWIGQEPVKNQQDNAKKGQDTCQRVQARYTELQHEEDDLRSRIQEAGRLPKHLYGRSGSKSYGEVNPARPNEKSLSIFTRLTSSVLKNVSAGTVPIGRKCDLWARSCSSRLLPGPSTS